jgi:hypothetical protein
MSPGEALFVGAMVFFSLLWVFTLVPFVLSLSFRPRHAQGAPRPLAELKEALLATGTQHRAWRLTALAEKALRMDWDVVDASWHELFAKVKLSVVYRMRIYLQEETHEVRTYESLRTGEWFLGFDGWTPRFRFSWWYQGGALNVLWSGTAYGITRGFPPRIGRVYQFSLDTAAAKRAIEEVANRMGWTLYPTTLPFEVSPWAMRLGARLTPGFMRTWSRRKFWGVLHAVAWAGIFAAALTFVPWTPHNQIVMLVVFGGIILVCLLAVGAWRLIERLSARRANRR